MGDFKVQRVEYDVPLAGGTQAITAVSSISSAFELLGNNRYMSAGPSASNATMYADDLSMLIELTDTDEVTYTRASGSYSGTTRSQAEILEYIGPSGGDNEFIVRGRYSADLNGAVASKTVAVSGVSDPDKCIPIITGIWCNATADGAARSTAYVVVDSTSQCTVYVGGSSGRITVNFVLVEFTGANWNVGHGLEASTTADSGTIDLVEEADGEVGGASFDVGDWDTAIIFGQHRGDSLSDTNDAIADNWPLFEPGAATDEVDFTFNTTDHDAATNIQFVHVLQHNDMSVDRVSDTGSAEGSNNITLNDTLSDITQAFVVGSRTSSGGGTAYARGWANFEITSTTNVDAWCHRSGNTVATRIQVADLSGIVSPQEVEPSGLATTLSIGAIVLGLMVSAPGTASSASIGSPAISLSLEPSGVSSTALGSPEASQQLRPVATASTASIGSPVLAGVQDVQVPALDPTIDFGTALLGNAQSITPTSIFHYVPQPPDTPDHTKPLESECDIVIDAQLFTITFQNDLAHVTDVEYGTWTGLGLGAYADIAALKVDADSTGNPVGSANDEINLISQAYNMAVAAKTYNGNNYAGPLGHVIIGLKGGNGGTVHNSSATPNASPSSRVSTNSINLWDAAKSSSFTVPAVDGPHTHHGVDISYVALDADAQMRHKQQGPAKGKVYDAVLQPDQTYSIGVSSRFHDMKLRPGLDGKIDYYSMIGHLSGDLWFIGVEYLPMIPSQDGQSYQTTSSGGAEMAFDAKSGIRTNHNVYGTTIYNHCGTSGDFASTAQQSKNALAGDKVVFSEHNLYTKGGGPLYVINNGTTRGSTWPNQTLHPCETNRTFTQCRPDPITDSETVGRTGDVIYRDNTIPQHGVNLLDSAGGHINDGGNVLTVWSCLGSVWLWDNTITECYYGGIAVIDQSRDKNKNNQSAYPIDTVYVQGNTITAYLASGSARSLAIFSGIQYLHLLGDNSFTQDVSGKTALTIDVDSTWTYPGVAERCQVVYGHDALDLAADSNATRSYDGSSYNTTDAANPVATIPEWVDVQNTIVGAPLVATLQYIQTTGVASTTTIGDFNLGITPDSLTTSTSIGTATLSGTGVSIAPSSIEPTANVSFRVKLAQLVLPSGTSSTTVGAPSAVSGQFVIPTAVASGTALGSPSLLSGQIVTPASTVLSTLYGDAALVSGQFILPNGVAAATTVGVSELTRANDQIISPEGIASTVVVNSGDASNTTILEDAAISLRLAIEAALTVDVQWDNSNFTPPADTLWARAAVMFASGDLIMVGNGNTYRRTGTVVVEINSPLRSGEGEALEQQDLVIEAIQDQIIDGVRLHHPETDSGQTRSGWWVNSLEIDWDFDETIPLTPGAVGSVTGVEDIRSVLRQRADAVLTIPTIYANDGTEPPENDVWARFSVLFSRKQRVSRSRYRIAGIADVSLFAPLGEGDGELLAIADEVVRGFLPATHSGVTLRAPYVTTIGRSGAWWQISVSCPFFAEI